MPNKAFKNNVIHEDWEDQTDFSAEAEGREIEMHENMHRCIKYIQRIIITILLVAPLLWAIISFPSMAPKFILGAVYPILGSLGVTLGLLVWMKSREESE